MQEYVKGTVDRKNAMGTQGVGGALEEEARIRRAQEVATDVTRGGDAITSKQYELAERAAGAMGQFLQATRSAHDARYGEGVMAVARNKEYEEMMKRSGK